MVEEEEKELLRTLVISKAALVNRSSQEEIDSYQDSLDKLINVYYPGKKKEKEETKKAMEEVFTTLFRGPDGKPKTFEMNVGEAVAGDIKKKR